MNNKCLAIIKENNLFFSRTRRPVVTGDDVKSNRGILLTCRYSASGNWELYTTTSDLDVNIL